MLTNKRVIHEGRPHQGGAVVGQNADKVGGETSARERLHLHM